MLKLADRLLEVLDLQAARISRADVGTATLAFHLQPQDMAALGVRFGAELQPPAPPPTPPTDSGTAAADHAEANQGTRAG